MYRMFSTIFVWVESLFMSSRRNFISDFKLSVSSSELLNNISRASSWVITLVVTKSMTSLEVGNLPSRHFNVVFFVIIYLAASFQGTCLLCHFRQRIDIAGGAVYTPLMKSK